MGHKTEFSLTPTGLLDRLQAALGLIRADSPRRMQRAVLAAVVAWVPLLVITVFRRASTGEVDITFFHDIAVHVRFLLAVPLLILVEGSIGGQTSVVAGNFLAAGLVSEEDTPRFQSAVRTARKRLDSFLVDVILLVAAYALIWHAFRYVESEGSAFWFRRVAAGGVRPSAAGWWYVLVSAPISGFLLLRWAWRYAVWAWFLGRVARLDLRLTATHPDRMGGLGFVGFGHAAFAAVPFAGACITSAAAANRILYEGASLKSYQSLIVALVVASVVVGLAPLLAFTRPLAKAKRRGLVMYGRLATGYVQSFERKWIDPGAAHDEPILGTSDIQSLADLGGSFERVQGMKPVLLDRRTVFMFALAAAAPMLPLFLTVMPFKDILKLLLKAAM